MLSVDIAPGAMIYTTIHIVSNLIKPASSSVQLHLEGLGPTKVIGTYDVGNREAHQRLRVVDIRRASSGLGPHLHLTMDTSWL